MLLDGTVGGGGEKGGERGGALSDFVTSVVSSVLRCPLMFSSEEGRTVSDLLHLFRINQDQAHNTLTSNQRQKIFKLAGGRESNVAVSFSSVFIVFSFSTGYKAEHQDKEE